MPKQSQDLESQSGAIDVARYAERERARLQAVEQQWRPLTTAREKERQGYPISSPSTSSGNQPRTYPPTSAINLAPPNLRVETSVPIPSRVTETLPRINPPSSERQQWPAHKLVFEESPPASASFSPTWSAESPVWPHGPSASGLFPSQPLSDIDGPRYQTSPTERARPTPSGYEPNLVRSTHDGDLRWQMHPRPRAPGPDVQQGRFHFDMRRHDEDSEGDYEDHVEQRLAEIELRRTGLNTRDEEAAWRETLRMREEAIRLEQGAKVKDAAARRKEEAVHQKELETLKKEADLKKREDEVKRREEELNRRDTEEGARQQYLRQEEFRKRVEEIRRRTEERKRQDRAGSYWKSRAGFTSYASASQSSSAPASSARSGQNHGGSTTENPNGRNNASSSWSGNTRPAWSSTRPSQSSRPRGAWVKTTSTGFKSGTGPQLSGSDWARRQAEQAKKRQEQFRLEQERLERDRQAKAGKLLSKEEVVRLFETHHRQWSELYNFDVLRWDSFPWPILRSSFVPDELTTTAIGAYVLSPHYPGDAAKTSKDRIKEHIKRWHPDRFETKLLPKVVEGEREKVKHGAGLVARCLNDLLTRSNVTSVFS